MLEESVEKRATVRDHYTSKTLRVAALMLISQAIPCIMHLENRVGEKLITVLIARAAEKFQQRGNTRNLTRFAAQIQHIVNTRVLGSMTRPKQWKVPLSQ